MILGLDVSTSITGATVIDESGKILYCEAWKFQNKRHFPDLIAKASKVKENLLDIQKEYDISAVFIEQSLFAFMRGKSSAKTLLTLSKFNEREPVGISMEFAGG